MDKHFDEAMVATLIHWAIMEYEEYAPFGAEIENGLDIAIYDMFEDQNEPEGLYEHTLEVLKKMGY